jgi:serine/threonine protein kinase
VLQLPENEARFIFGCLVTALEVVHAKGYTHHDVKAANFVRFFDGKYKLIDFDNARLADKVSYLAPGHSSFGAGVAQMPPVGRLPLVGLVCPWCLMHSNVTMKVRSLWFGCYAPHNYTWPESATATSTLQAFWHTCLHAGAGR